MPPTPAHDLPVSDELVGYLIDAARAAHDDAQGISIPETILLLRTVPALLEELLRYRAALGALYAPEAARTGPAAGEPLRRNVVALLPRLRVVAPTGPEAA